MKCPSLLAIVAVTWAGCGVAASPAAPPAPSGAAVEAAPPSAPAPAPAPTPSGSATTTAAAEARVEPNGDVIIGPAGAMRKIPGPDGAPPSKPIPFPPDGFAKLRSKIRRCYERSLQTDPAGGGKVTISVVFDVHGDAKRSRIVTREGLSDEVARCLLAAVSSMNIGPGDDDRDLVIPFVLAPPR